ncbi:MAG: peptidyl-alpha-hydroxyglycine alpha-amidating lyase family protein [Bacteroidota bacterium]|nr:peptidyl-alpha-hydroxyglycine alpha-amidating lyase family protein [Bacteroidota bacterium]MDP4217062.1 peptidyl-alpha-hydroxyglycine alpha-amidating lyase family protein [Bacteroidota bacterium]MDP4244509.1 peptidyl-alpha-hydroxyglycine alpha-amidating lyase family protein [Bacteroidota bacterium]MDP4258736.1 peptidyl-alpha-hydroxyglycine alpha-amidating lyase family protein [Bacteroidota bacterium]
MITYTLQQHWPNLPADLLLGNPTGLAFDSRQDLFIFHRAGRRWPANNVLPPDPIPNKTILRLDRESGRLLDAWGENLFLMPHGLTVDAEDHIWVTDVGTHQVFQFSRDGHLLMTLGEAGVQGADQTHFAYPTHVAIAKDGSIYVSDGYANSRVVKFSAKGEYQFEWGQRGAGAGEFHLPHAVELDEAGNVYVADRENRRIQVFSPTGQFIAQWKGPAFGKMSWMTYDKVRDGWTAVHFFDRVTADGEEHYDSEILFFDANGQMLSRMEGGPGKGCWFHNIVTDKQGNIYVSDIKRDRLYKFIPGAPFIPNAATQ